VSPSGYTACKKSVIFLALFFMQLISEELLNVAAHFRLYSLTAMKGGRAISSIEKLAKYINE
jgi:hypothetical protein